MTRDALQFGLFVPQGWRLDLVGIEPAEQWGRMLEVARRLDAGPWHSAWVYDHFHTTPQPTAEATHEAWTLMAALAASTSRVRLGQMCTCMGYRNPAYLAKVAATVDVISGGRLEFGIGAGWYEHEWRAYGYGFPGVGERISALRDGVQIIQRLWAEGEATLESETFSVDGAICRPQPLQTGRDGRPRIPTWIAGGGEQRTLRYAAKWGDATNFGGSPEQFARKRDVLLGHLEKEGRDPAEVRLTSNLNVVVRETEAEARRVVDEVNARADSAMRAEHAGTGFSTRGAVVGTPQMVIDHVGALREAGLGTLIAYMPEVAFEQDGIELFEREVMSALR
ncbi:TIGR03560 family F420-dependent LLM class oxidoreductase [Agrococcus sp. HG114]|uniref:TIGR03560 family F420-dependent LLM class oxidoreductase n=1 Tax=Agrococcus sp. HG114 TaxID=2969757 RepID=UPI00215ADCBF|nr:TIGR03560 family F420-dependent LLM class oxidoreductase [Agrococcus sp. HG114]MCR8670299.1 TIGR03560 family F420-dependent LLM class oxidoreductase [Agrococcus sp. HG114]